MDGRIVLFNRGAVGNLASTHSRMFSSTVQKPNSPGATFLGPEFVSVIWDALPLGGLGRLFVSDCESLSCHKAHTTTAITTDLLPLRSYLTWMSHTQQQHCKSHPSFYLESHLSFLDLRPMKRNGAQKLWHWSIKKMQIQCLAVWILLMTKDNLFIIKGDWFVAPSLLFHAPFISNGTELNSGILNTLNSDSHSSPFLVLSVCTTEHAWPRGSHRVRQWLSQPVLSLLEVTLGPYGF